MAEMVRTHMTTEAFLQLPETNLPTELISGEFIEMNAPNDLHQKTSMYLISVLLPLLPVGEFRSAPTDVLLDDLNVFQPDLFWVSVENTHCKVIDGKWYGAPDLVIEIFSPSTERRDKKTKFDTYERHGVREYWMVDPQAEYIEVWLQHEGKFDRFGIFGPDEKFVSSVLNNQTVDVAAVFK
jgi:Uma2 family endonuclease